MLVLGLDTSSPAVSAALVELTPDGPSVLAERVVVDARRHGELLALGVQEVRGDRPLDAVVSLRADTDELVRRLLLRAQTDGRVDDNEETIRARLQIYHEQTAPLLQVYGGRGVLVEVDGLGPVDEVSSRLFSALDSRTSPAASPANPS